MPVSKPEIHMFETAFNIRLNDAAKVDNIPTCQLPGHAPRCRTLVLRYAIHFTEVFRMKLGLVTYNLAKDWDVDTIIEKCEKSGYEGVELEARGDGKTYKFSLTPDLRFDSIVYRARFTPSAEEWSVTRIPFSGFDPTFRGDVVSSAPPLDPGRVSTFGFLISDKQEGNFRLAIRSISAY